jgi:hypothetical protein
VFGRRRSCAGSSHGFPGMRRRVYSHLFSDSRRLPVWTMMICAEACPLHTKCLRSDCSADGRCLLSFLRLASKPTRMAALFIGRNHGNWRLLRSQNLIAGQGLI